MNFLPIRFAFGLALWLAAGHPACAAADVEAHVCALIETAAPGAGLPTGFLTRLIWQESSFRPGVTSPAGAQGIAQFMPATAGEQALADPFDPDQAIPKAAGLLADLKTRFGNIGLAAAAYNAGPARVTTFLQHQVALPSETQAYVLAITRTSVADWAAGRVPASAPAPASCLATLAEIRRANPAAAVRSVLLAPWGVQIAGSFSKAAALRAYATERARIAGVLGGLEPMVLGGRVRSRGFRPYYQVRAPAASRAAAEALCRRILTLNGACVVLRS